MSASEGSEPVPVSRSYTSERERFEWWYFCRRFKQDHMKQTFRTRRKLNIRGGYKIGLRARIGNSDEVGVFLKLTNKYLLVGGEEEETENFRRTVKGDIPAIPIINTSLASCKIIGCMCVGNKYGLIVPESTTETELRHLQEELPDSIEVKKLEERLSALGNVIACNDRVALIHPDLDKESQEIIENALQVETFRYAILNNPLVGSYCILNNSGGLVPTNMSNNAIEDLSSLLDQPVVMGTVNNGSLNLGSGLIVNDSTAYAGMKTTHREFVSIEALLNQTHN